MGLNVVSKLSREKEGCGNARVNASSMLSGTVDVHLMELISDESDAAVMRNVLKKIYGESFFGVHKYPKNTRRLSGHLPCITRACQWNSCSGLLSKEGFQWATGLLALALSLAFGGKSWKGSFYPLFYAKCGDV